MVVACGVERVYVFAVVAGACGDVVGVHGAAVVRDPHRGSVRPDPAALAVDLIQSKRLLDRVNGHGRSAEHGRLVDVGDGEAHRRRAQDHNADGHNQAGTPNRSDSTSPQTQARPVGLRVP